MISTIYNPLGINVIQKYTQRPTRFKSQRTKTVKTSKNLSAIVNLSIVTNLQFFCLESVIGKS